VSADNPIGYRSFDRQWIIPDKRLINRPNPALWGVRSGGQVYLTAPQDTTPTSGPAATLSAEVPDVHHYKGSFGGRVYALWLDPEGTTPNVVPGLLGLLGPQYGHPVSGEDLFAYLAAVLVNPAYTALYAQERALAARMHRQEILDRADGTAPRLVAVITEASLMYRWGTQAERRDLVASLVTAGRRPNVELRLLRFEDGPHPGMSSLINLFGFPDDEDESIVYLETDTSIQEISKAEDVAAYAVTFGQIRQASLPPGATAGYLEKLAETLE